MKCEKIQERAADYLKGDLTGKELEAFRDHLEECPACRKDIEEMELLWGKMDAVLDEEPGPALERDFRAMLDAYSQGCGASPEKARESRQISFRMPWFSRPEFQAAAAVIILAAGVFWGRGMEKGKLKEMEIASLRQEVTQMRELVTISMLTQSSAIDRLQGISMSRDVGNPDDRLLEALIKTMETDPNVNVRMAAVDALGKYGDREWIRKALVISLESQSSPLVQVSLIDLLVELREPKAKDVLKSLISDENSPEPVRNRARAGLEKMI
ncbi:MAG: zf-HC2 domain-containing protein [Candidatus Latescibacterota bacterium]